MSVSVSGYSGTYDGKAHGPQASASVSDAHISWSVDDGRTWTDEVPSITDAGTLNVLVRAEHPNYQTSVAQTIIHIAPASAEVTALSCSRKYGEKDPELSVRLSGIVSGEEELERNPRARSAKLRICEKL